VITTAGHRRAANAGERPGDGAAEQEPACRLADDYAAVELTAMQLLRPWRRKLQSLVRDVAELLHMPVHEGVADLHALTENDPATLGDWQHVLASYLCYRAVLAYRVAHAISLIPDQEARTLARCISERAKVDTGVEIHPNARIGQRLVIDHGIGTVIGETAVIGADCYLLQGVVLGATGISGNIPSKRHPTLGDRVEVGGFARILGPVNVGDDVVIGCHTLVRQDIPAGSRVTALHQYQIVSGIAEFAVDDIELTEPGLRLRGRNLDQPGLAIQLLGPEHEPLPGFEPVAVQRAYDRIVLDWKPPERACYLRVSAPCGASITASIPHARARRPRQTRQDRSSE
jgi:serine O-acetyltransferase